MRNLYKWRLIFRDLMIFFFFLFLFERNIFTELLSVIFFLIKWQLFALRFLISRVSCAVDVILENHIYIDFPYRKQKISQYIVCQTQQSCKQLFTLLEWVISWSNENPFWLFLQIHFEWERLLRLDQNNFRVVCGFDYGSKKFRWLSERDRDCVYCLLTDQKLAFTDIVKTIVWHVS